MDPELQRLLANIDWEAARVPTQPVDADRMPDTGASDDEEHVAIRMDAPDAVEDGEELTEFTDEGVPDQGLFGDGAFVPAHWWEI